MIKTLINARIIEERQEELLHSNPVLDFIPSPITDILSIGGQIIHVIR